MDPYSLDYTRHSQYQLYNTARIAPGLEASSSRAASTNDVYGRENSAYSSSWTDTSPVQERPARKLDRPWEHGNDIKGSSQAQAPARQPPLQQQQQQSSQPSVFPSSGPTAKRGSRACMACRRGKNRCEWDPAGKETSCRRCLMNGTQCVFEKPAEKSATRARANSTAVSDLPNEAENRITSLEKVVETLSSGQTQMQTTLQQILTLLPQTQSLLTPTGGHPTFLSHNTPSTGVPPSTIFASVSPPQTFHDSVGMPNARDHTQPDRPRSPQNTASGRGRSSSRTKRLKSMKEFPPLPGFAPPNHRFGTYGIIPLPSAPPSPSRSRHSSRSSSSSRSRDEYSSALPHETLTAPIQALQALANAADQAAALVDKDDGGEKGKSAGQEVQSDGSDGDSRREEGEAKGGVGRQWKMSDENDEDRGRSRKRKRVTIDGQNIHLRVRKKTRPDPTPRNPFPDVVTKGLVSEEEARELWDIFFSGCHYFVPLWDKSYDTYETYIERTPFSTNSLLAVAAKIRAGNGPVDETFHRCLEEAQGIARSTLFGPIVRKEAVMAMLILSLWSQNGWLPCGHALRMGLDINIHRALDKLANKEDGRTETEERDLVVSARIWLNCYMHEHLVSLGTGKPILLRDDSSVRQARKLLDHPMASDTDMRLIAGVELVNIRITILEHLTPLHGSTDAPTISFVKSKLAELQAWHQEWYDIHKRRYDDESVVVKLLETERVYAELWTVCVALRGCSWDKLSLEQKELAFHAKDCAWRCLEIFLRSDNFRKHLKYATHDQLVSVAFAAVFLLKVAILYPTSLSIPLLVIQVSELAHCLSAECFAERYALTLRLMLSNFRRTTGALSTIPGTPRMGASTAAGAVHGLSGLSMTPLNVNGQMNDVEGSFQNFLSLPQMENHSMEVGGEGENVNNGMGTTGFTGTEGDGALWDMMGLEGFDWPTELSPSSLPVWLQDGNATDLGLPVDGSDSLFLPVELANMFMPSNSQANGLYQFTLPDSGDVGAEAW
ncbi:hypothetical protein C362_01041 [Cryptococcus neoformans Bt1]|nr:hypothetical protein C362_01041 [Cryptococcus neoformans var. grubii Bt1]OXG30810.1 hypothetical protein C367_01530 [Cryptococcus neoformans var. grubii Ze90-1]